MKKHDTLGFTLVEIIVVLVIIAILAALIVPALTGYIQDAREKSMMSLARNTFAEVNGVLQSADPKDANYKNIVNWGNTKEITYNGPKDNSVTLPNSESHHDWAKNAIRNIMGGEVLPFGYRMILLEVTPGHYMIKRMEVFYKVAGNAGILVGTPDLVFGDAK